MKLPKIKELYNSTLKEELFLNTSDDVGFALGQVNQLSKKIQSKKNRNLKLWERKPSNIYISYQNKSKTLKKIKYRNKTQNKSSDWKKQTLFNPTEISEIENADEIRRSIKTKYDIKYKYKDKGQTISDFLSTKNDTFLANTMIKLLKEQKTNVINKGEKYSRSLRHEILLLDKDINKFDDFTIVMDKKKKEDEAQLNEHISQNKNLVNLYKKQLHEYNNTIYEIFKILKSMNNFKFYADFIHELLGGDNAILHCDLIGNINFKDFKNYDVYEITQTISNKLKKLLKTKKNINFKNEIHNFDLSFKDMEDKLVKLFIKKHEYNTEIKDIKKELKSVDEEKKQRYDSLYENYQNLLDELNESIKEYKKMSLTKEEEDYIKFNYSLLTELNLFLCPKFVHNKNIKDLNVDNEYNLKFDVISPIFTELNNIEDKVNGLIKSMEECSKENNELFQNILTKRKNENRALKLLYEKNIIKIKEELKRKKYYDKMKKIIIKDRHKYNLIRPHHNFKIKQNKFVKTETNLNDYNYLYYS